MIGMAIVIILAFFGFILFTSLSQKNTIDSNTSSISDSDNPGSTAPQNPSGKVTPSEKEDQVKEVIVSGGNYKFNPSEIKVKKGERVKIIFKNSGGMHDFVIDEFNVRTQVIGSEKEDTVEFVPDKTGTFEYYCSVGNHRQMGMVGNLIVE